MMMDRRPAGRLRSKIVALVGRVRENEARKRKRAAAAERTIQDLVSDLDDDVFGLDDRIDDGLRRIDRDLAQGE